MAAARLRPALLHPLGLGLALASALMAGLVAAVPYLAQWSARAPWVLGVGLAAYAACAVVAWTWPAEDERPEPSDDEQRQPLPKPPNLVEATHHALLALNELGTLARCELLGLLPLSVGDGPTAIDRAKTLRTLLVDAIDRLNVPSSGRAVGLQYKALRLQYVEGLTVVQVAIRLGISEQTLFRRSKDGREAVADDLWGRELLLRAATPARQ